MVPLAWVRTALEEQEEVLGPDPWAYGLTPANRKNLETVLRYRASAGLIRHDSTPLDELFADTDLGEPPARRRRDLNGSTLHDLRRASRVPSAPACVEQTKLDALVARCTTARISSRRPIRCWC